MADLQINLDVQTLDRLIDTRSPGLSLDDYAARIIADHLRDDGPGGVRLRLPIEHSEHLGGGEVWTTTMSTPFVPRRGDEVTVFSWRSSDGPDDGYMVPVRQVWWRADGVVVVTLERHVIDAAEGMQRHLQVSGGHLLGWWTDRDGDLRGFLRAGGWALDG